MKISKTFSFEAAHYLPNVGDDHQCAKMHGHSYSVDVAVEGPVVEPEGWVLDYARLSWAWDDSGAKLDHSVLNDALDNPTAEHLAMYLARSLYVTLPGLVEVTVHETAKTSATWTR